LIDAIKIIEKNFNPIDYQDIVCYHIITVLKSDILICGYKYET